MFEAQLFNGFGNPCFASQWPSAVKAFFKKQAFLFRNGRIDVFYPIRWQGHGTIG